MKRILVGLLAIILLLNVGITTSHAFFSSSKPEYATVYQTTVSYDGKKYPISLVVADKLAYTTNEKARVSNFKYFCKMMKLNYTTSRIEFNQKDANYKKVKDFISKQLSKNAVANGFMTMANVDKLGDPGTAITVLATSLHNDDLHIGGKSFFPGVSKNVMPSTQLGNYLNTGGERELALYYWVRGYNTKQGILAAKDIAKMSVELNTTMFKKALK